MDIISQLHLAVSPPTETHPIIQCITNNDLKELSKLLKDNNVNGVHPCSKWGDYITPLIAACITNNDLKNLKKLLKDNNINGVYPCSKWGDYITPLIAAVVNNNTDICSYVLRQGADPNIPSQLQWTPLHYVSRSKARPDFVDLLLKAKANPDGWSPIPLLKIKIYISILQLVLEHRNGSSTQTKTEKNCVCALT
uniref:Uncharacterized protein n=1 Tax=Neolamprologus brichardi TaxID=32507 RepID=A0A3Q4GNN5_NEOBR